MSGKLRKFFHLPFRQKMMFSEALFWAAFYRFQVLYMPFAKLSLKIGTMGYETPDDADYRVAVRTVRTVVESVCRHTPWESKCLVRALTAKEMLNRRGYPCTLYMGVQAGTDGKMEAHAWLRCGNLFVTGGKGNGFAVTGIFGDKDR